MKKTIVYLLFFMAGFYVSFDLNREQHLQQLKKVKEKSEAVASENREKLVNATLNRLINILKIACRDTKVITLRNPEGSNQITMTCGDRRTFVDVDNKR